MIPIGYLAAIGIALVFAFRMDGAIGVMMLAFLLVMPLLSLAVTLIARHGLQLSVQLPEECSRGQRTEAALIVTKRTPLPMPFLRMRFYADAHFAPLNTTAAEPLPPPEQKAGLLGAIQYRKALRLYEKQTAVQHTPDMLPLCLSMSLGRRQAYTIPLETRYCGSAAVRLAEIELTDFLKLFRFRIKQEPAANVLILPQIPSMQPNNRLFQSVANEAITADDDNEATPVFSASAAPGYEHRDYVAGDSLKRVNWKLSSKRRKLMVRKDEPASLAKLTVVLDFHRSTDYGSMTQCLAAEQLVIETALGLMSLCLQQGYPCVLHYQDETAAWTKLSAEMPEQLACESVRVLRGGFRSGYQLAESPLLPPDITHQNDLILMYFTVGANPDCAAALEQLSAVLHYVQPKQSRINGVYPQTASLWQIGEDNRLIPLQS